jgi:phosphocarrier protein HPr
MAEPCPTPETPPQTRKVILTNRYGLHARPAALFVELCNRFRSRITVGKDEAEVNGKNILDVMTLGADAGTLLILRAAGPDAVEALAALVELVEGNFGEDEKAAGQG